MNGAQNEARLRVAAASKTAKADRLRARQSMQAYREAVKHAHGLGLDAANLAEAAGVSSGSIYQHLQLQPGRNSRKKAIPVDL